MMRWRTQRMVNGYAAQQLAVVIVAAIALAENRTVTIVSNFGRSGRYRFASINDRFFQ